MDGVDVVVVPRAHTPSASYVRIPRGPVSLAPPPYSGHDKFVVLPDTANLEEVCRRLAC